MASYPLKARHDSDRDQFARAIPKGPALLILDEATHSLDSEDERPFPLALDRLMR
ncbi:MAG: hypothetical protein ABSF76_17050 [Opitutaceae bacterium]|jgi:ABC-type bacteriocin/lantibiotic exporter with double-glycine peptidase domain